MNKILLITVWACTMHVHAEIYFTEEQAGKWLYPTADEFRKEIGIMGPKIKRAVMNRTGKKPDSALFSYFSVHKNDVLVGYLVKGKAKGKHKNFNYIMAVNTDLSIRLVELLDYHESHGGEIRYRSFTSQFTLKRADNHIRIGKDIDSVTGATISSKSITDNIRYRLICLTELLSHH